MGAVKLKLSEWQSKFMQECYNDEFVIANCAISSGKTRVLAMWIVMQSIQHKGMRSIMIAQTFRSLKLVLTREIEVICQILNIKYTLNRSEYIFHFSNGSVIFSFSAENPSAILGMSEIDTLVIDESSYVNETIYNYARDRMRGGKFKPKVRLISSPQNGDVSNWFIELVKRYPQCVLHATLFDNPFVSDEFKAEMVERYREGSNLYRQQILAEILDTDSEDALINLSDFKYSVKNIEAPFYIGIDMGGGVGGDFSSIVVRNNHQVILIKKWNNLDSSAFLHEVKKVLNEYTAKYTFIDNTGGYGIAVYDQLKIAYKNVIPVNFGERAIRNDIYANQRAEMYVNTATAIRNGFNIGIDNLELKDELRAQRQIINNSGKLALKSKEEVKKIVGRSPDVADALALSFCKKEIVIKTATATDVDAMINRLSNNFLR